jgi:hypothetical protein
MAISWRNVDAAGSRQYGVVVRPQLAAAGMSAQQVKDAVAAARISVLHQGVSLLAGVPRTPEAALFAAVAAAGPGAAASHSSAAWLWGLLPDPPERPQVLVPLPRHARLRGVDVHRTRAVDERWIRRRRGITTVDPLRAMLELGDVLPAHEVRDCLERGVMAGLFSIASLEWAQVGLSRSGRNGCGVLRGILNDRALGKDRPDGMLEPRMAQLIARYGLPKPVFQYRVHDDRGRFVARVDFAYPELRGFLEVDGYETHGTPDAMERDYDRQNRLTALGWTPARFTWRMLVRRPPVVARQIRELIDALS